MCGGNGEGVPGGKSQARGTGDPGISLLIQHPSISKEHAYLETVEDNKILLKDMDSLNGTKVNGQRLEKLQETQIQENDIIEFGKCKGFVMKTRPSSGW